VPRRKKGGSRPAKAIKSAKPPADKADVGLLGAIELREIQRLIRLVQKTGIGEIELSSGGRSVRISARGSGPAVMTAAASPPAAASAAEAPAAAPRPTDAKSESDRYVAITSPMVGTFYRAPAPDADPYVEVGSSIEVGTTVCIVEAMKLMNEIESEVRGKIVKALVENAQPVEYGQTLFLVDPS
jgi:acetyl-CoA carboxylase biotin carboxyl carrier protein